MCGVLRVSLPEPSPAAVLAPAASPEATRRLAAPWPARVLDIVSTYLPVLLMAMLALGTWWLVENTPLFEGERAAPPPRHEPDYTMQQFMVQRFAPDGTMRAQIEGDVARHYPDTDTLEIDNPRIRATGTDGRATIATAKHALSNVDGSELQLTDDARVVREATATDQAIEFRGEFLHAFLNTERVRSHLPVVVTHGSTEVRAAAMEYDNLARVVTFKGRTRAVFQPAARKGKK